MQNKKRNPLTGCKRNGKLCPNCGKVHPDRTGKNNPSNYPGVGEKIRKAKLESHPLRGKTYIEVYGKDKAKEIIEKVRPKITGPNNTWFGRHHTIKSKTLMSEFWKGKRTGKNHWSYRTKVSLKARENMSKGHIGVQALDKHPLWKNGISFLPYTREFNSKLKGKIRDRDSHTCQKCGIHECKLNRKLDIHHIDYEKKNTSDENLISLCGSCNASVNVNRWIWTLFFQGLIEETYLNVRNTT